MFLTILRSSNTYHLIQHILVKIKCWTLLTCMQNPSPLNLSNWVEIFCFYKTFFAYWGCKTPFPVQTSEREKFFKIFFEKHPPIFASHFKQVKGVFKMPRLSKKAKQEWDFFISSKTGRRTYNDLCRKCRNSCKQSFRAIVVDCSRYSSKRSVPNRCSFDDSSIRNYWSMRIPAPVPHFPPR